MSYEHVKQTDPELYQAIMGELQARKALQAQRLELQRFPGLKLAYDCLAACEGSAAVLNAANEVAVEAFLERRIAFTAIHAVNCRTLESVAAWSAELRTVDDLLDLDRRARDAARRHAKELTL